MSPTTEESSGCSDVSGDKRFQSHGFTPSREPRGGVFVVLRKEAAHLRTDTKIGGKEPKIDFYLEKLRHLVYYIKWLFIFFHIGHIEPMM